MATTVVIAQPQNYFDEHCHKYKCCCGCCHVKTGTLVIAILQAIGIVAVVINSSMKIGVAQSLSDNQSLAVKGLAAIFYVALVVFIIQAIALVCLFIGWAMENRFLLIPFMGTQVLQMLYSLAMMIFFIVVMAVGGNFMDSVITSMVKSGDMSGQDADEIKNAISSVATSVSIMLIIVYAISLLIEIWLFTVVLGCFRFFRDKQEFFAHSGQNVQYQAYPAGGAYPPPQPAKYN